MNTTTTSYPKRNRRPKALLTPPKRVNAVKSTTRVCQVKLHRFEREKSQLFTLVDENLNAAYTVNSEPITGTMEEWEKSYLVEMITGLFLEILNAKKS